MNNRFVRAIRSGEIGSIEALKSEFKRLAKLTHPDLRGVGEPMDDFIRVRSEYEKALAEFERYRFGYGAKANPRASASRVPFDRISFYASLISLFKRGFPKTPRHEKERQRYEYARYLALIQARAWAEGRGLKFENFEIAMIGAKAEERKLYDTVLDFVLGIFEYHLDGAPLIREDLRLRYSIFIREQEPDPAIRDFLDLLIEDMDNAPVFR